MKRSEHVSWRKRGLAAVLAAVLLLAAGCGAVPGSPETDSAAATGSAATAAETIPSAEPTEVPVQTVAATVEETEEPVPSTRTVAGVISYEAERFNRFLTGFVQQDIENTLTELDEDAELVRFAFRYLQTNDPDSVLEREEGDDPCRSLTLEQVNETLSRLLGRTVTPDREDYSILTDESEEFHCSFHDGRFWHTPPYHVYPFGLPVRFALVDNIDEETHTLHFRFYKANVNAWDVGETDRHITLLPAMSFLDAEGGNGATRDWIIKLGEGEATLRDFGEELQLVDYVITRYH